MKIKPASSKGRILMELGPEDSKFVSQPSLDALKLKNILVPVDFSECSEKAFKYAMAFAKTFNASLTVLYVVQIAYGTVEAGVADFEKYKQDAINEGRKKLAVLAKQFSNSVPIESVVRVGSPYDEVVRCAQESNADLILISTHGRTGLKRFFLGSTTEKVVRHAPCPVLVVREQEHEFVDGSNTKGSRS